MMSEEVQIEWSDNSKGTRGEDDGRDQIDPASDTWLRLFGVAETHVRDVRFTPKSGHSQRRLRCPLSANSGHLLPQMHLATTASQLLWGPQMGLVFRRLL